MVNKGFVKSTNSEVSLDDWLLYLNNNVNVQSALTTWAAMERDPNVSVDEKNQYALLGAFLQDLVDYDMVKANQDVSISPIKW
jgi:hypothetical protein